MISAIVPRADKFKEKVTEVNKLLALKYREKGIPLILHDNINLQRHPNKLRLHFNNYGDSIFVRNLKQFFNRQQQIRLVRLDPQPFSSNTQSFSQTG